MTCEEMLARLDDYLDRNLSPDDLGDVEQHLNYCLACLHTYRFEQALLEGIRSRLRRISLPAGLTASIRLRIEALHAT